MPRLWNGTIEAHRREVRAAVIAATTALVSEQGLRGVTMSRIAAEAGIGRATLYKYFPDVESILDEWHHEQVSEHLSRLHRLRQGDGTPRERLARVLTAFALMTRAGAEHGATAELMASLHGGERLSDPELGVRTLLTELVSEGVEEGELRSDIPVAELALFCLNAASGARHAPSRAAARRLVDLALSGVTHQEPAT